MLVLTLRWRIIGLYPVYYELIEDCLFEGGHCASLRLSAMDYGVAVWKTGARCQRELRFRGMFLLMTLCLVVRLMVR